MQTITQALKNIQFPVTKDQLIQQAEQKGMAEMVPLLKEHLPAQTFTSAEEVLQKLPLENLSGAAKNIGL